MTLLNIFANGRFICEYLKNGKQHTDIMLLNSTVLGIPMTKYSSAGIKSVSKLHLGITDLTAMILGTKIDKSILLRHDNKERHPRKRMSFLLPVFPAAAPPAIWTGWTIRSQSLRRLKMLGLTFYFIIRSALIP